MKRLRQRPILVIVLLIFMLAVPALASHIAHKLGGDCGCSPDSDWCSGNSVCHYSGTCSASEWGCGTFGLFPCNGTCSVPPNGN